MKEGIIEKARQGTEQRDRLNLLREELHHLILQEADRKGAFGKICFIGGTALRILYGLDRFSEDLDFSLSSTARKPFSLESLAQNIGRSIAAFGFNCRVNRMKTEKNVQSCFFSFSDLMHPVDRSFQKSQILAIKFEVDTRPPAGAVEIVSPVTNPRLYKVRHHDLNSLFAGKLHAILCRAFIKGRDFYDFLWYTGRPEIKVNKQFLQNAIEQTEGKHIEITDASLRALLVDKFSKVDFERAKNDVTSFLPGTSVLDLFARDVFVRAVEKIKV